MMIFCHSFDNPEITALEGKEELAINGMECNVLHEIGIYYYSFVKVAAIENQYDETTFIPLFVYLTVSYR